VGTRSAATKRAVGQELDKLLAQADPPYERASVASQYVRPGELVWRSDAETISRFVTFAMSIKQPGFGAVYLAWSRLMRFPEKSIRPWFITWDVVRDAAAAEGSLFLSTVAPGSESWIDFSSDAKTRESIGKASQALLEYGLPFLRSLE
jgi:hypothetical protein